MKYGLRSFFGSYLDHHSNLSTASMSYSEKVKYGHDNTNSKIALFHPTVFLTAEHLPEALDPRKR